MSQSTKPPSGALQHPAYCPHTDEIKQLRRDVDNFAAARADIHDIKNAICGNIVNGTAGLYEMVRDHKARLDDLEEGQKDAKRRLAVVATLEEDWKKRSRIIWSILTAAIGLACVAIWTFIFGK